MDRFFGMMPTYEIEKEAKYVDKYNRIVTIQAGTHGWAVIYSNGIIKYKDEEDTIECNFARALAVAEDDLIELSGTT